ncbi:MAG: transglycosylase SLT domain-containing protein [Alphaproteobacteria bacterium]|nr:transglycosylase SLT domain-containing protein [Alphaproteobacteria bacterium]MDX5369647.1 transglycosylase SLT domain-containing protein [Alphaproteobacteria bacterium]MDX5464282.1 transglycosylase SLT domain-containing protein [Alphaproteobacteria bacterium]
MAERIAWRLWRAAVALAALSVLPAAASAGQPVRNADICRATTAYVEQIRGMPPQLLAAVSLTETGRSIRDEAGERHFVSWPWTINAEGKGYFFDSKEQAIAKVRQLQAQGMRSIDVGCMQINLRFHGEAFDSLEEAFDPLINVTYAAEFLTALFDEHRSWKKAIERYHSATEQFYVRYRSKVYDNWLSERERVAMNRRLLEISAIEQMRAQRLSEVARRRAAAREQLANNS